MGQSLYSSIEKTVILSKKVLTGGISYECKMQAYSGSGATTPPQEFSRQGDAPAEAGDPQKKTHSLLPPGLICHRVAPDRSLFLAGLRP